MVDSERVRVMREYVSALYPGRWAERVANMPASQVIAIFHRTYHKPAIKERKSEPIKEVQITIWDILKENAGANEKGTNYGSVSYLG